MSFFAKLKLFFKLRSIASSATKEVTTMDGPKPGYLTTEFWGKTLVQLFVLLNTFVLKDRPLDPQIGVTLVASLEALYNVVRMIVKAFHKPAATVVTVTTPATTTA
jgi:hypothetical protein